MIESHPIVAIRTLVYNHELFLRDYFEGIIKQQTNFPFIAVIHDDCSTDNSTAIIKEYSEKYPDIIKPIFEESNCYQNGKWDLVEDKMRQAYNGAKYLAFCEGDDYWTDPYKLQRAIDFLEANPDYSAIGENGLTRNSIVNKEYLFNDDPSHDVNMEEIIITRRFPTAGVVCRMDALNGLEKATKLNIDTILWCWLLTKGKFRYEQIVSSVYRKGAQGMTVSTNSLSLGEQAEKWQLEILRIFNVNSSFINRNIARLYFNCSKYSLRNKKMGDTLKCIKKSIYFLLKSL